MDKIKKLQKISGKLAVSTIRNRNCHDDRWEDVLVYGDPKGLRSLASLLLAVADDNQRAVSAGDSEHAHVNLCFLEKNSRSLIIGRLDRKKAKRTDKTVYVEFPADAWFSVREFKGPQTPAKLLKALQKEIGGAEAKRSDIEALNEILRRKDLYKFMPKKTDRILRWTEEMEKGNLFDDVAVEYLNRELVDINFPKESPAHKYKKEWESA